MGGDIWILNLWNLECELPTLFPQIQIQHWIKMCRFKYVSLIENPVLSHDKINNHQRDLFPAPHTLWEVVFLFFVFFSFLLAVFEQEKPNSDPNHIFSVRTFWLSYKAKQRIVVPSDNPLADKRTISLWRWVFGRPCVCSFQRVHFWCAVSNKKRRKVPSAGTAYGTSCLRAQCGSMRSHAVWSYSLQEPGNMCGLGLICVVSGEKINSIWICFLIIFNGSTHE